MKHMTDRQKKNWKSYCSEPPELIENYQRALAEGFVGWCIHHRLEIQQDGTRVSMQELIDQGLYYDRPASELVFMRFGEHTSLHNIGNTYIKGRHHSEETRHKIAEANKGKTLGVHWWNNGIEMKMSRECPGEGWTRGRLRFK